MIACIYFGGLAASREKAPAAFRTGHFTPRGWQQQSGKEWRLKRVFKYCKRMSIWKTGVTAEAREPRRAPPAGRMRSKSQPSAPPGRTRQKPRWEREREREQEGQWNKSKPARTMTQAVLNCKDGHNKYSTNTNFIRNAQTFCLIFPSMSACFNKSLHPLNIKK